MELAVFQAVTQAPGCLPFGGTSILNIWFPSSAGRKDINREIVVTKIPSVPVVVRASHMTLLNCKGTGKGNLRLGRAIGSVGT